MGIGNPVGDHHLYNPEVEPTKLFTPTVTDFTRKVFKNAKPFLEMSIMQNTFKLNDRNFFMKKADFRKKQRIFFP